MTARDNAYWDELGVEWRALNPDPDIIGPRLKSRLRRQSLLIRAGLMAGLLLSAGGVILSLITIWMGWTTVTWNFVTRGIAIGAVSVLLRWRYPCCDPSEAVMRHERYRTCSIWPSPERSARLS